jgi:transcription initiation factor TFIIIB Brf1 subunit/transcription initiation factor TFIIB
MLMQHLTFKDAFVYRVLLGKEPVQTRNSINCLLVECRALYAACRQHTVQWSSDALVREWTQYKSETLTLIHRLNRLVADERRTLYTRSRPTGHLAVTRWLPGTANVRPVSPAFVAPGQSQRDN